MKDLKRDMDKIKGALIELMDYIQEENAHIDVKDLTNNVTRITVRISDGRCESRDIDFKAL